MAETLLTIRPGEPDDAVALCEIYADAWQVAYQGIIPHIALQQMINHRGPRWWCQALRSRRDTLLLEFDGSIAGYAAVARNRRPNLPFAGEITELYLQPHFQGLGFGSKLFGHARHMLARRGLSSLIVWSLKDNETACAFYKHQGGKLVAQAFEQYAHCELEKVAFGWREE